MAETFVLTNQEFDDWTNLWKKQADTTAPYPFFHPGEVVQTGVVFHFKTLRYLLSTTGVATIKARFGLRPPVDGGQPEFHVILFGADNRNIPITPYYICSAYTHHHHYPKISKGKGNLPQVLMRRWKKAWYKQAKANEVDRFRFLLKRTDGDIVIDGQHYELLLGYTYSLAEVVDTIATFPGASHLHVKFGLHQYYARPDHPQELPALMYTFGLILYAGVKERADRKAKRTAGKQLADLRTESTPVSKEGGDIIEESGYYDFTAPCPHTC